MESVNTIGDKDTCFELAYFKIISKLLLCLNQYVCVVYQFILTYLLLNFQTCNSFHKYLQLFTLIEYFSKHRICASLLMPLNFGNQCVWSKGSSCVTGPPSHQLNFK